ncbi:unnamed protein product [Adineta steineri]|uniref:3-hydroxyisobutyryl-CoA hydrolase, mitochondrial n=2 Tax=Adineta steineri TaxID=433720 RepID=A0A814END0_9BILA|nr:unnamed protein product [Adineta steineri]
MNKTAEGNKHAEEFFRKEYTLNYLTGNYKLPYVAIINGITMGGGVGLSVHGPFRIATETTTIAMPETAIGLFPDVGGSHFLPRLSNNLGVFLGLTGYRLRGIDVLHAGFATHFVPTNRLEEVERKLVDIPKANYNTVKDVLDKSSESVNSHAPFSLQDQLPLINRVFSIDTKNVETILERLKSDGSDFALKQLATLEKMSPTSLKLTFEQLKRGQKLDLKDCLIMEYRLAQNTMIGHDFYEGVRAAIMNKTAEGNKHAEEFFRKEYTLNYLTGNYKLPYVAIINGITMGGGVGLSVHGPFRIATETTTIAMPETAIGLFPDVGGSHFLSRLSNNLGVFLGLTGYRLRGIDVLHAGFATHFVPTNRLEEVERKLVDIPKANYNSVKDVLDKSSESVNSHASFSLQDQLPLINRVFSIDTKNVETILERLKSDGSDFALKQLATLEKMSPTSLKLTFEQLKRGQKLDLKDCLIMEYRLAQNTMIGHDFYEGSPTSLKLTFEQLKRGQKLDLKDCLIMEYRLAQNTMIGHDFYEGVRAVLVDKDNKPQWKPNSLKNVSDKEIEDYFKKPSSNEDLQI